MGTTQSTLTKNGYVLDKETENAVVATKGDDTFLIKKIILDQTSGNAAVTSEIETLKSTSHPHIVSCENSFQDQNTYYVVMDYCHGGSLAAKIREMSEPPQESEVLSWIVEICMALKTIHEKGLLHKHLTPENIFLTEFGTVCLGGFGKIHENSKSTNSNVSETIRYLAPEVFAEGTYDAKSDMWSVGCILYELCTLRPAFSAETTIKLIPKILRGRCPPLPMSFCTSQLLDNILNKDPRLRPTASEILEDPIIITCLSEKCKTTVEELQTRLDKLREVADKLERVHQGATIGSLAGGVIGAVGGITSIVGLTLAPFTLGASLIVTGVGVGVGAVGGVTAGVSNITNMVNQSSDRKAVRSIIKEFEQKMKAVVAWLQVINNSLQTIRSRLDSSGTFDTEGSPLNQNNLGNLGFRAGKGLGGIAELIRLVRVMNIGKVAAQASRVVRVAELATGVFSGLFVAVDIFFIAMDAKEIHHIRQAQAAEARDAVVEEESVSETETNDQTKLFSSFMQEVNSDIVEQESDRPEAQDNSSQNAAPIRSEIMKFVQSIRKAADDLQQVLDVLKSSTESISSPGNEREVEWQDMELM